ncbi:hypothetical protein PF001_g31380 [Phytophthora fragariae]|uniref:Uncharacterized protein n=1 Tax=Phytophthora fragariae TaxID=53985 RepID=A0A6A4AX42_9STRA|nr:hypothetical protein PF001_g31380 [Phytophthora fragariae]
MQIGTCFESAVDLDLLPLHCLIPLAHSGIQLALETVSFLPKTSDATLEIVDWATQLRCSLN